MTPHRLARAGVVIAVAGALACGGDAPPPPLPDETPKVTALRFQEMSDGSCRPCTMVATVGRREVPVLNTAGVAMILDDGRTVIYNGLDGSGGYENEGHSLWRWDIYNDMTTKIMSEYFQVEAIRTVKGGSGRTAIAVTMRDGGQGIVHAAVVDPNRGEVWREPRAAVVDVHGDTLIVHRWKLTTSWDPSLLDPVTGFPTTEPEAIERLRIDSLLALDVIVNPREPDPRLRDSGATIDTAPVSCKLNAPLNARCPPTVTRRPPAVPVAPSVAPSPP